eukprot:3444588-Pleurochrysis_carterae.AAC.3
MKPTGCTCARTMSMASSGDCFQHVLGHLKIACLAPRDTTACSSGQISTHLAVYKPDQPAQFARGPSVGCT